MTASPKGYAYCSPWKHGGGCLKVWLPFDYAVPFVGVTRTKYYWNTSTRREGGIGRFYMCFCYCAWLRGNACRDVKAVLNFRWKLAGKAAMTEHVRLDQPCNFSLCRQFVCFYSINIWVLYEIVYINYMQYFVFPFFFKHTWFGVSGNDMAVAAHKRKSIMWHERYDGFGLSLYQGLSWDGCDVKQLGMRTRNEACRYLRSTIVMFSDAQLHENVLC